MPLTRRYDGFEIVIMCLYETDAGLLVPEQYRNPAILRTGNLFPQLSHCLIIGFYEFIILGGAYGAQGEVLSFMLFRQIPFGEDFLFLEVVVSIAFPERHLLFAYLADHLARLVRVLVSEPCDRVNGTVGGSNTSFAFLVFLVWRVG